MNTDFLESGALLSLGGQRLMIGRGESVWSCEPDGSFYFPNFFLDDPKPWLTHTEKKSTSVDVLLNQLKQLPQESMSVQWEIPHFSLFEEKFHSFMKLNLKKVVPYIFAFGEGDMTPEKLTSCLIHLLSYAKKYPVYVYGYWENGKGLLGATPEMLFSLENQCVRTEALAGTQDKQFDSKERQEHQFVIDGIKESLDPFGLVEVGETRQLKLSHFKHLATPIKVKCQPDFMTIASALHPTPALGAYPKKEGEEWLKDYQTKIPRERFGAPVGYSDEKGGRCYVAIRNVQWKKQRLKIGAGCGIIKESILEKEWKELNLKVSATSQMLGL